MDNVEKKKVITELSFKINEAELRKAELALQKIEARRQNIKETRRLTSDKRDLVYAKQRLTRTKALGNTMYMRERREYTKALGDVVALRNRGITERAIQARATHMHKSKLKMQEMDKALEAFNSKENTRVETYARKSRIKGILDKKSLDNYLRKEEEKRVTAGYNSSLRQSDRTQSLYTYEQKMKAKTNATYEKEFIKVKSYEDKLNAKRKYDYEKYVSDATKLEESLHKKKMAMQDRYNAQQERELQKIANTEKMHELKAIERKREDVRQAFKKAERDDARKQRDFIRRTGFRPVSQLNSSRLEPAQDPTFWTKKQIYGLFKAPASQRYTVNDNPVKRMKILKEIRENAVSSVVDSANQTVLQKINNFFKTKRRVVKAPQSKGGHSYMDSGFQRNMMYLGSAMLIQYAIGMVARGIANTLNNVANTEVQTLQGNAFRNDLIKRGQNVEQFDNATKRYSELSGTSSFVSRAKFAGLYGRLRGAGIDTNNLDGNKLVETIRGLELYTGDTGEQVDKKLFDLLSGKASKNERKEFGVTAQNNPVEILKQIHATLEKNPFASVGMNRSLLKDVLNNITQIPQEMVQNVHSKFPEIFNEIANSIKDFADGFFGTKDKDVEKRWIALFATIRSTITKVFTEETGKVLGIALTDSIGSSFATLRDTIDGVVTVFNALKTGFDDLKKSIESIPGYKSVEPIVEKVGDVGSFANDLFLNPGNLVLPAITSLYDKGATPRQSYQGSYMTGAPTQNTQNNGITLHGNNVYIDSYGVKIDSKINEVIN